MKRIALFIVSLFMIWTAEANDIYEVTASRLNVRISPPPSARVIGKITKGNHLEVMEINNAGWARIEYKNRQAYVNSKYLRFVHTIIPTPIKTKETEKVVAVELHQDKSDEVVEDTPIAIAEDEQFHTLLNGPGKTSRNFELYYGLSVGAGYSSFMWGGELANGCLSYTADVFAELYFKNNVSFIPEKYFVEIQLGYDAKGAAWYPMNYVHTRIYPIGYKLSFDTIKIVGKAGLYLGYPLSDVESYDSWDYWSGNFQVGATAAIGVEYKQFCVCANVEYNFTEVASTPVTLNNIAIFGSLSYKFGKFKH